jgi:exopolyphosphatase / guanosine-5'-triphosphate,3'-diphosphate pyrophosphatase
MAAGGWVGGAVAAGRHHGTNRHNSRGYSGVWLRAGPALPFPAELAWIGSTSVPEPWENLAPAGGDGAGPFGESRPLPVAEPALSTPADAWPAVAEPCGRPRRPPPAHRRPFGHFAALDLGTNNCRLLVARPAGAGFRVVDAFSRIVRLGEGLAATGALSEAAMARTLEALAVCTDKLALRRGLVGRYVATEACRRAANCEMFLSQVRDRLGLDIETISTAEEARLVVTGCAPLLNPQIPYAVVFDIGGGSTEIVWVRLWRDYGPRRRSLQILGSMSLPLGVVNLTDRFGGEVSPLAYRAMVDEAAGALAPFERRHRILRHIRAGRVQMLGSSGTVTTLAGIHLALPRYTRALVDGSVLTFPQIAAVSAYLAALDLAGRAASPCVGRERADLVLSGCAILDAICATWPVGRLWVADRGVREGILFDLMQGGDGRRGAAAGCV